MAYLQNNNKIKKQRDVKITKKNMKLKLELVQEQLSGTKFGQIAGGGMTEIVQPYQITDHDFSIDSSDAIAAAPFLRKVRSTYDPELAKKEEKENENKRLELEKNEKDLELFEEFSESEQNALNKLDNLTRIFLFLRKHITNPIISCDEIDIKYAVKDFSAGALHCQNRIERIGKIIDKSDSEKKVLKGLTERKTMIFNIFSTLVY
jgi:hypothetical protein